MQDMQEDIFSFKYGRDCCESHAERKKHASSVKVPQRTGSVSDFFKKKEVTTGKCSSQKSRETSCGLAFSRKTGQESSQLTKLALRKKQHKAEILWPLKSVMSHFSYSSAGNIVDVFKAMFPDSNIAQGMSWPTNCHT